MLKERHALFRGTIRKIVIFHNQREPQFDQFLDDPMFDLREGEHPEQFLTELEAKPSDYEDYLIFFDDWLSLIAKSPRILSLITKLSSHQRIRVIYSVQYVTGPQLAVIFQNSQILILMPCHLGKKKRRS